MRCLTVILDATDTPKSIAVLAALGSAIEGIADAEALHAKSRNIKWFRVYAEQGNDAAGVNGPARISFEQGLVQGSFKCSRVVATQHGQPLLPGLPTDFLPDGLGGAYDFRNISISGQTGDQFQIIYDPS